MRPAIQAFGMIVVIFAGVAAVVAYHMQRAYPHGFSYVAAGACLLRVALEIAAMVYLWRLVR